MENSKSYINDFYKKNILIIDDGIEKLFLYKKILNINLLERIYSEFLENGEELEFTTQKRIGFYSRDEIYKKHPQKINFVTSFIENLCQHNYEKPYGGDPDATGMGIGFSLFDRPSVGHTERVEKSEKRIFDLLESILFDEDFQKECPSFVKYFLNQYYIEHSKNRSKRIDDKWKYTGWDQEKRNHNRLMVNTQPFTYKYFQKGNSEVFFEKEGKSLEEFISFVDKRLRKKILEFDSDTKRRKEWESLGNKGYPSYIEDLKIILNNAINHIKYIENRIDKILIPFTLYELKKGLKTSSINKTKTYFSKKDIEESVFFKSNPLLKKHILDYIGESKTLMQSKSENGENYNNVFYIDTSEIYSETELREKIKEYIKKYNIQMVFENGVLTTELKKNISKMNIPLIEGQNETVNYSFLEEKKSLIDSFQLLTDSGKNFYAVDRQFFNLDTLRIEDVYILNFIKQNIYKKTIQGVKLNPELVEYFTQNKDKFPLLSLVFQKDEESQKTKRTFLDNIKHPKLELNVLGLELKDKNDILNFSRLSSNYKFLNMFFQNINEDIFNVEDFSLMWYLNDRDFRNGDNEYFLLDTILKKYKQDLLYLMTEDGKKIRTAQNYSKLKDQFIETETSFKKMIVGYFNNIMTTKLSMTTNFTEKESKNIEKLMEESYQFIISDFLGKQITLNGNDNGNLKNKFESFLNLGVEHFKEKLEELFNKGVFIQPNPFENKEIKKEYITNHSINYSKMEDFVEVSLNWYRVNFELEKIFPLKKIISDFEKIEKGENIFNQKDSAFEKLRNKVIEINKDPRFLKLKESNGFYLFQKDKKLLIEKEKEMSEWTPIETVEESLKPKKYTEETTEIIDTIFEDITNINNYYTDNEGDLTQRQKDIMKPQSLSLLYEQKLSKLNDFQKEIIELLNSKDPMLFQKPGKTKKEQFVYYYHILFNDIKRKMEDKVIDINVSSNMIKRIGIELYESIEKEVSLEGKYFELKSESDSLVDNRYIVFKKKEQKNLKNLLNQLRSYGVSSNTQEIIPTIEYILETLNEDIGDMVLEKKDFFNERNLDKTIDYHYYYIARVCLNHLNSLTQDPVINSLKKSFLIDDELSDYYLKRFVSVSIKKSDKIISQLSSILKEYKDTSNLHSFIKQKNIKQQLESKHNELILIIFEEMKDMGMYNYDTIKKHLHLDTLVDSDVSDYSSVNGVFETKILEKGDFTADKTNKAFLIMIDQVIPIIENCMKYMVSKYNVAFIVCSYEMIDDVEKLKIKRVFSMQTEDDKIDGRFFFDAINNDPFPQIDYDETILDIKYEIEPEPESCVEEEEEEEIEIEEEVEEETEVEEEIIDPYANVVDMKF